MGKRSNFERNPRDFYPTPYEAVIPLIPFIEHCVVDFIEPCAGDGTLVRHLESIGLKCKFAFDIEPQDDDVVLGDATSFRDLGRDVWAMYNITNPPWDRPVLHSIIENLRVQHPTWLLIDADWAHTKQAAPYLKYCSHIVAVGRVKWIPDSKYTGKDNCCWYKFDKYETKTVFYGRI